MNRKKSGSLKYSYLLLLTVLFPFLASDAIGQQFAANNFYDLSLEELMNIEVYSVAKKDTKLQEVATAIHVISEEDIRRSGATSLPEVLRLAPGLQVTRVNAHTWAIGVRGFADVFSNKLLIMIDGRTVYRPVFSGTFWDEHLIPLSDVKQIEVIRGPGATVWGANAVNGVVNIIRKTAKESKGVTITAGAGNVDESNITIVQGSSLNENWDLKLYGNEHRISSFDQEDGSSNRDGISYLSSGFSADGMLSDSDSLRVQGDVYRQSAGDHQIVSILETPFTREVSSDILDWGTNLMTSWESHQSKNSTTTLQAYYDRFERESIPADITVDTVDLDFQHNYIFSKELATTYGFNWRFIHDETTTGESVSFDPESRTLSLFSSFLQAEFALTENVELTLGSKFEHNDYTGFEIQPSVRGIVHVDDETSLWLSVARAVRTPARSDRDLRVDLAAGQTPEGLLQVASLSGDSNLNSEDLLAFELGGRTIFNDRISFDLATFINRYDDLVGIELKQPRIREHPDYLLFETPTAFANGAHGVTYGAESVISFQALESWKLVGSYSWVKFDLTAESTPERLVFLTTGAEAAENIFNVRSLVDITPTIDFDTFVYYVDHPISNDVSSFVRTDFRLGWEMTSAVSFSLVLQNAFDGQHRESVDPFTSTLSSDVPRSIFGYVKVAL